MLKKVEGLSFPLKNESWGYLNYHDRISKEKSKLDNLLEPNIG